MVKNIRELIKRFYSLCKMRLFSSENYKIYMKINFQHLNKNALMVKLLSDFCITEIDPIEVKAPFGDSMLVVAPHQDDEMIGCGGAILSQLDLCKKVAVLFVCDGGDEFSSLGFACRGDLVRHREAESLRVAREINIDDVTFLRFTDIDSNINELAISLAREINKRNVCQIFTPFFLDGHFEHQIVTRALGMAMKMVTGKVLINCYEVWGNCIPNIILNIDKYIEKKKELISYYESQCKATDYVATTAGKNMYNSRSLGKKCKYAERYFQIPKDDFVKITEKIY